MSATSSVSCAAPEPDNSNRSTVLGADDPPVQRVWDELVAANQRKLAERAGNAKAALVYAPSTKAILNLLGKYMPKERIRDECVRATIKAHIDQLRAEHHKLHPREASAAAAKRRRAKPSQLSMEDTSATSSWTATHRPGKRRRRKLFLGQCGCQHDTGGDIHHSTSSTRDARHDVFAEWVATTLLRGQGSTSVANNITPRVLDVAGGKGHLCTALLERGLPCALVDPCALEGRNLGSTGHFDTEAPTNDDSQQRSAPAAPNPDPTDIQTADGRASFVIVRDTIQAVIDGPRAKRDLVDNCLAMVGLHPDEATEAIVDAGLKMRRPFAVIPCCVLPQLFPARRLNIGTKVKKYGAFLDYLQQKDPRIRKHVLDLPGRNIVLYMTAEDFTQTKEEVADRKKQQRRRGREFAACALAAKKGDLAALKSLRAPSNGQLPAAWNTEVGDAVCCTRLFWRSFTPTCAIQNACAIL